ASFKEDVIFVALGKDVKECQSVLMWALHNSGGKKICILHVHQPAQKMPMMGTKVSINLVDPNQVKAYHDGERQEMLTILGKYLLICAKSGVQADKLWNENLSIEKGIVELILKNGIQWLVMGGAA
ncbi:hypothetical protein M569_14332, partial [Genlisea aurea]